MTDLPRSPWPIFRSFQGAGFTAVRFDLVAGLTLAAIAIPEQMAMARLGGFSPHIGFLAFVAGSVAFAIFGSNRYLSAGADPTITTIFAGGLATMAVPGSEAYVDLSALLALLVGLLLMTTGLLRVGWIANLLSLPFMSGIVAGVAIHIALSQAPALLGLPDEGGALYNRVAALAARLPEADPISTAIGLSCVILIAITERISPRLPAALIALTLATCAVLRFDLQDQGVVLVGDFDHSVPNIGLPAASLNYFPQVLWLSAVIAIVIMVQSARVSSAFPGDRGETPDVNRDCFGLGFGGVAASLVGAFPVSASPTRTAIVARTGGRTQFSGLVASAVVVVVAVYGSDLLGHVPRAAVAGVLLFVAGRTFPMNEMLHSFSESKAEFALVAGTMFAVVILPVQTGVALAILGSLIHHAFATPRERFPVTGEALGEIKKAITTPRPLGSKVFICYRRRDTSQLAGRIYDHLVRSISDDQVFLTSKVFLMELSSEYI